MLFFCSFVSPFTNPFLKPLILPALLPFTHRHCHPTKFSLPPFKPSTASVSLCLLISLTSFTSFQIFLIKPLSLRFETVRHCLRNIESTSQANKIKLVLKVNLTLIWGIFGIICLGYQRIDRSMWVKLKLHVLLIFFINGIICLVA